MSLLVAFGMLGTGAGLGLAFLAVAQQGPLAGEQRYFDPVLSARHHCARPLTANAAVSRAPCADLRRQPKRVRFRRARRTAMPSICQAMHRSTTISER